MISDEILKKPWFLLETVYDLLLYFKANLAKISTKIAF
jgi:hypothetical protein